MLERRNLDRIRVAAAAAAASEVWSAAAMKEDGAVHGDEAARP